MATSIELSVHLRNRIPPLIVQADSTMLEPMDPTHAKAFSERLNLALTLVDLPSKFHGRNVRSRGRV